MAGNYNFRSAVGGFNRQDVVNYISLMQSKHNTQMEQMNSQLQATLSRSTSAELQAQVEDLQAQLAQANAQIEALKANPQCASPDQAELEAYRRAEKAERQAQERAKLIYQQANAVLADVTVKAEEATQSIAQVADQTAAQLMTYKETFQNAVAALYAIRPEEE